MCWGSQWQINALAYLQCSHNEYSMYAGLKWTMDGNFPTDKLYSKPSITSSDLSSAPSLQNSSFVDVLAQSTVRSLCDAEQRQRQPVQISTGLEYTFPPDEKELLHVHTCRRWYTTCTLFAAWWTASLDHHVVSSDAVVFPLPRDKSNGWV